jgi:hypothetical protein
MTLLNLCAQPGTQGTGIRNGLSLKKKGFTVLVSSRERVMGRVMVHVDFDFDLLVV